MPILSQASPKAINVADLFREVMLARTRVYRALPPTPLEIHEMAGDWRMLLKREDLSAIHSFKWRGAYNFVRARVDEARKAGLVAASAGNHAQGVALATALLGVKAHLFMPKAAQRLKVDSVARLGGSLTTIELVGDDYDEAAEAALEFARETKALYVPPYDDVLVMAGQGVLADEMMTSPDRPDVVFAQIGGGGLAAGVASVLKSYDQKVKVIGVEAEGQASMAAAFRAGHPTPLERVDVFCDGTAVKTAGYLTFPLLSSLLDDLVAVSAQEVSAAIEELWRVARVLPEPSGALGLAGARRMSGELAGLNVGVILSGANLDFRRLSHISRAIDDPVARQAYYRVTLPERQGAMLAFLKDLKPLNLNISHLMVGQFDLDLAYPVVGFEGDPDQLWRLEVSLKKLGYEFSNVSSRPDLPFRVAPFQPRLFRLPYAAIVNFPERPGALTEFLERISHLTNISYFNYVHSGELIGRALAVFSFEDLAKRARFLADLKENGPLVTDLAQDTLDALGLTASTLADQRFEEKDLAVSLAAEKTLENKNI
ncbi:MAG: pyridoxal-phosphate dependent enzyme [Deltaproteobacteria bacterium]|jgi:threonine dehydratase|nr:pyridoxal-phosphate dependent enzyme [Deltaproteobacteria bacterium]